MPLSRISIKTAVALARGAVTLQQTSEGYVVRMDLAPTVHRSNPMRWGQASVLLRQQRMFFALLKLGVEITDALPASEKVPRSDWVAAVSAFMERRALLQERR